MFLQSPEGSDSSRAASALLSRLDRKRRDRWSEAVQTIDFSHSSCKAWSILNNLTGRSRRSSRHCAVSANAIASALVSNGKYEDIDRKSSRLVSQEVSNLWRASTTSAVNVCGSFNSKNLEKSVGCRDPQINETCSGPQELSPDLFALCPLQDPREAHLHSYRAHCRPASPSGASWVPTVEVHSKPNCSTYPTHQGLI